MSAARQRREADDETDVPTRFLDAVRSVCLGLPEAFEEPAWLGTRWKVRTRTFAHLFTIAPVARRGDETTGSVVTAMTFRSAPPELEVLLNTGHPFFRPGWGTNVVGMVLDEDFDPDEVAELLTESYCVLAPKKLVQRVERPPG